MNKLEELATYKALVHHILSTDERARNSDSYLYMKVLSMVAEKNGINLDAISVPFFLLNLQGKEFPPFETVRRNRQLLQHDFPELQGSKDIKAYREENEKVHREYARSGA
jgi:hypothetical protein